MVRLSKYRVVGVAAAIIVAGLTFGLLQRDHQDGELGSTVGPNNASKRASRSRSAEVIFPQSQLTPADEEYLEQLFRGSLDEIVKLPESDARLAILRARLLVMVDMAEAEKAILLAANDIQAAELVPSILLAWAATGHEGAAIAWKTSKAYFASDGREIWVTDAYVRKVFSQFANSDVELALAEAIMLKDGPQLSAWAGIGEQVGSDSSSQERFSTTASEIAALGEPLSLASFYAGAGHTGLAKEQFADVDPSAPGWSIALRHIGSLQAAIEPREAIVWVASRFSDLQASIPFVVSSVGESNQFAASDVLNWLHSQDVSPSQVAGIERLERLYPLLRDGIPTQDMILEDDLPR